MAATAVKKSFGEVVVDQPKGSQSHRRHILLNTADFQKQPNKSQMPSIMEAAGLNAFMGNQRLYSVTLNEWGKSADRLAEFISELKATTGSGIYVKFSEDDDAVVPITSEMWARYVGKEHDEYTCYFRHWFRKLDGRIEPLSFSPMALMPLVRSAVWQGLLFEYVTGKLLKRDAIKDIVIHELKNFSSLGSDRCDSSYCLRMRIGQLAQDFFGIVKNNLHASDKPLNNAGFAAARHVVIHLPTHRLGNSRKGWSNRKLRRELAEKIIDAGLANLPTRTDQESFIYRWLSCEDSLKQSAVGAIVRILKRYVDAETGECLVKPWSRSELSRSRSEAQIARRAEHVMNRTTEILKKISNGEKLTAAERVFKSHNKELFGRSLPPENVRDNPTNCKENKYITDCRLIPNTEIQKKFKNNNLSSIDLRNATSAITLKETPPCNSGIRTCSNK